MGNGIEREDNFKKIIPIKKFWCECTANLKMQWSCQLLGIRLSETASAQSLVLKIVVKFMCAPNDMSLLFGILASGIV